MRIRSSGALAQRSSIRDSVSLDSRLSPADFELRKELIDLGYLNVSDAEVTDDVHRSADVGYGEVAIRLAKINENQLNVARTRLAQRSIDLGNHLANEAPILAIADPECDYVLKVKAVRSKIMDFAALNADEQRIVVVGVGRSLNLNEFVANLAVVTAQFRHQTLLIDADLRSPSLHRIFGIEGDVGLVDHLDGRVAELAAYQTLVPELWLMPAGKVSRASRDALDRISLIAEIDQWQLPSTQVLVALPNVYPLKFAVGATLRGFDCAIIAVQRGVSAYADVQKVIDDLDKAGIPVAGSVML